MEKIGIIIQARTGSTRLPGKVVKKIEGRTVLEHVVERLKRVKRNNKIILATTKKKEDNILEKIAEKCRINVFRGSENDVLGRFYRAAKLFGIDHIVRITADCPLIDSEIVDKVIEFYFKNNLDHASNSHPPTYPDGMDVEVFSFRVLQRAWEKAKLPEEREHVTIYILKNPKTFKIGNYTNKENLYDLRLALDEKKDLVFIKKIYKGLYKKNKTFGLSEIISFLRKYPGLLEINKNVISHPLSRWGKNQKIFKKY